MTIWPGEPYPLGATYDGLGVNFALFSEVADGVELCLFDDEGNETRLGLPEATGFVWHGYVPGLPAGQRYGFRVHGPWAPEEGHRCQPSKLLLDPYARAIEGETKWNDALFSYRFDDPDGGLNDTDSAPFAPRSVVVNPYFDWGADRPLRRPLHETVIYETHVKGFTMRHPDIPTELRGTYAGLAHPAAIRHLSDLGVTAVELLPVHQFIHDSTLAERGLRNYWGYNSIGFFAPHNGYSRGDGHGDQVAEFKQMVVALHEAGIEVILDVVYNHTAEGNHLGPTLCFRGIDNAAYYRLMPDEPTLLHGLHRYRQHAQCAPAVCAPADHGQPALLGAGDARRRVPLRPGRRPRPRGARGRAAVGLLRPDPAGPGGQPGQADRRAVGRR